MHKSLSITGLFCLAIALATPLRAGEWKISTDDDWCDSGHGRYCEVREITVAAWKDVSARTVNGQMEVTGWDRDEIRVRARIRIKDMSREKAEELVREIELFADEDGIMAEGPGSRRFGNWGKQKRNWSVDFEVMVPRGSDVKAESVNGGVYVSRIDGDVRFESVNGGVEISDVGADVSGSTVNGGILVALAKKSWDGNEIDLETVNGGIKVDLPEEFSAKVDVQTVNGGIRVDHPIQIRNKTRRSLRGVIGDGGALVKTRTVNGGVALRRMHG